MDTEVLVLLFTSLLRVGMPFLTDLVLTPNAMTWTDSKDYCRRINGYLIILDSKQRWNDFLNDDFYLTSMSQSVKYWIGMRFNDPFICDAFGLWTYSGWGVWYNKHREPNNCPKEKCVRLQWQYMHTSECNEKFTAICEIRRSVTYTAMASTTTRDLTTTTKTEVAETEISSTTSKKPDSDEVFTTEDEVFTSSSSTTTSGTPEINVLSTSEKNDVTTTTESDGFTSPSSTTTFGTTEPDMLSSAGNADVITITTGSNPTFTNEISLRSTTTTHVSSGVDRNKCKICCLPRNLTRHLDLRELEEIKHMLKVQLTLNKTSLSSHQRKLISVYDSRPTSKAMGALACVILAAAVGIIIVPDILSLVGFVYKSFRTQCETLDI